MNLRPYIEDVRRQLANSAEAGGDDARAAVERLVAPLDAALRLALLDALAAAAQEITSELAPGSVELRLRGRDPEFAVVSPLMGGSEEDSGKVAEEEGLAGWPGTAAGHALEAGQYGPMSRINLRMPEHLKSRVEEAAARERLSVNSWLVRAAATVLERTGPDRREQRAARGSQRYKGWAR
jgi:hypothetical protein